MRYKNFILIVAIAIVFSAFVSTGFAQTRQLPKTWQVNGNGYTGLLVVNQYNSATNEISGTLLGTPFKGYLVGRHLVLHRYPQGRTQIWDGWILDRKLGAQGQPYYNNTLTIAGTISEAKGNVDGVYPWFAIAQTGTTSPPPSGQNLIRNGSFENATTGNGRKSGIANWQVVRENVDVVTRYWQNTNGNNSIDLAGTPGNGAIQQSFRTIPGKSYEVSFSFAGNAACDNPLKQMQVSAAGQSLGVGFNTKGKSLSNMGWQRKKWVFRATSSSTTLRFENVGTNRYCGIALDNVIVLQL